ncbi:hypothetical protein CDAR_12591 [Caerostris darwini]|uniref:Uncharacterized protein n=1 Tax=Caerostris darwini TaxID=1538125 RepID=A0AAV4R237_9ARAC|nr:hypothetical protein CDAR_12591 [Caerostris darwini]
MYTSLGLALCRVDFELNHVVECVLTFIYCVISIVCLITSLSDVPSAMSSASILFQNVYNNEILKAELFEFEFRSFCPSTFNNHKSSEPVKSCLCHNFGHVESR